MTIFITLSDDFLLCFLHMSLARHVIKAIGMTMLKIIPLIIAVARITMRRKEYVEGALVVVPFVCGKKLKESSIVVVIVGSG